MQNAEFLKGFARETRTRRRQGYGGRARTNPGLGPIVSWDVRMDPSEINGMLPQAPPMSWLHVNPNSGLISFSALLSQAAEGWIDGSLDNWINGGGSYEFVGPCGSGAGVVRADWLRRCIRGVPSSTATAARTI